MWPSFVLAVMLITLLLPKIFSKKMSINHRRLNKYNFALYLTWRLVYTIVYSILHGQSAVNERSEIDILTQIDIFSNCFEILKGELAGGVNQWRKIANYLHSLTEIKSQGIKFVTGAMQIVGTCTPAVLGFFEFKSGFIFVLTNLQYLD